MPVNSLAGSDLLSQRPDFQLAIAGGIQLRTVGADVKAVDMTVGLDALARIGIPGLSVALPEGEKPGVLATARADQPRPVWVKAEMVDDALVPLGAGAATAFPPG